MNIHKARKLANLAFRHAYLLLIASFGLFPFIWTVSSSFKTQQELYTTLPSLLPNDPSLINYQYVLTGVQGVGSAGAGQLLILYRNSLVVSTVSTVSHVLIVSLAGYAFARLKFRGRDALFYFFIVLMFLPAGGTLMAQYELLKRLNLLDNLVGLMCLYTAGGGAALFLMRQVFLGIPSELEDAARVDGAGNLRIAFQIMFPLAASGMVLVAIMGFIATWGEYLISKTMIMSAEKMTLPPGVQTIIFVTPGAGRVASYGVRATSVALMVLPVILVFIFLQRWFIRGAVEGLKL